MASPGCCTDETDRNLESGSILYSLLFRTLPTRLGMELRAGKLFPATPERNHKANRLFC